VGVALGLGIPFVAAQREATCRRECSNNLKNIALGAQNYHDTYKRFPMAIRNDSNGQPMHGWQIALLPFMDQTPVYAQYRFEEPWDSQYNLTLCYRTMRDNAGRPFIPGTPYYTVCPSHRNHTKTRFTNYALVTGPGTLFPPDRQTDYQDVTDGTSNTLLAVEIDHPDVHWLQPWALSVETMSFRINDRSKPSVSSQHRGGANVVFVDAEVYFMTEEIDPQQVRALITISGGENVRRDRLINEGLLRAI